MEGPWWEFGAWPVVAAPELTWEGVWRWAREPERWAKLWPYVLAVITLLLGWVSAVMLRRLMQRVARRAGSEHGALVAGKLIFYTVIVATIFLALSGIGVEIKGLLAAAGILTVAISFAAQTSVSNVISGFFLLFDRPFSINDTIKVEQTLGMVHSIGLLSSKVRTFDNLVVRIPNEALLKSTITNYSLFNVRRIELMVTVEYSADLDRASEVLLEAISNHSLLLDEPAPVVLVERLGERGVELVSRVWCVSQDYIRARSELNALVAVALQEHGITIPFPQQVIYLRKEPEPHRDMQAVDEHVD